MGNSAVAVIHFDLLDEIEKISPRMSDAMLRTSGDNAVHDFGFGRVISWDHSSGYQVCVIHGNTGWRILPECHVPVDAEKAVAAALTRLGWKCTPPSKR
jgi:hypothetical protein